VIIFFYKLKGVGAFRPGFCTRLTLGQQWNIRTVVGYNNNSKPFMRTATANSILDKVENFVKEFLGQDRRFGFTFSSSY
jgi:hypothetical protein